MSATNIQFQKSLAAQQFVHQRLYKNLTHILERCEDFPKKTQSDDSLTRIHFISTKFLDASSADLVTNGLDSRRLPAGGACSCRSIAGRSVPAGFKHHPLSIISESTQTVSTHEMATQTGIQKDTIDPDFLDCQFSQDASTQSVINMQDAETQSVSDSTKNLNNTQTQTEMIVVKEPRKSAIKSEPHKKDNPEHEDGKPQKSNSSLRRSFFRRPVIVVNGGSFIPSEFTNRVHQGKAEHPPHPLIVTSQKVDQETQYENPRTSEVIQSNHNASGPSTCSKILDRVEELETKLRRQERSLKDLQGSVKSWKARESKPSECKIIFQAQPKQCQLPRKPETCDQAIQKKGDDDCECNRTLSKEFIQIFIKSESPHQTNESKNAGCEASSPNNIQKPIARQCSRDNNENCRKSVSISGLPKCCNDDKAGDSRKNNQKSIDTQCLEDADNFLQQFNRVFAKSKSEETICGKTNKIQKPISPCCSSIPSKQNSKQQGINHLLDKFVVRVTKPNDESLNARKASSTSCLDKNKISKLSQSNQTEEKEVYKSLIEQFVNLFSKTKTCENKQAHNSESESYSFDGMLAELLKLFNKPKSLEPGALMEDERPKKVTISEGETVLETEQKTKCSCSKVQRSVKSTATQSEIKMSDMNLDVRDRDKRPCELQRKSTISELYASNLSIRNTQPGDQLPCGCQFCGDGRQPVLDTFLSELLHLIGSRSFSEVVLTILRNEGNIYHINVREMATGNVLGCILVNGTAINEAIALGLFEDIHTFCELDRRREHDPRACPLGFDALCPRERGGEIVPDVKVDTERAIEFSTRVLGVPAGQAGRFFSLTNALKLSRKSPFHRFDFSKLIRHRDNLLKRGRFGRGAVTGELVYMGSDDHLPLKDVCDPVQTSSLFLRIVSGQDNDVQEDESKVVEYQSH
ncbi:uncharacterized protein LOC119546669 [Drosophila subpulchrella]|uniref:uncharacterized protein LOC119546669 n=1 Tax=Drosophila subpulchrella TaxID=1486046 RepID=UPI0018A18926|nr:uncharacterized protein LOC119546669 [Drosophila subpulchrella]